MSNIYLFIINSKKSGSVRHTNHIWTMTVYTDNNWEQKKNRIETSLHVRQIGEPNYFWPKNLILDSGVDHLLLKNVT